MSLITASNKHAFKEWLREYRKMFGPDPVIKDYMGLVSKFLTSSQTGVTSDANKPVNIVAWDTFDEIIDLTGNLIEGEYYYFPAAPNDQIRVKNGSSTVTLDFDNDGKIRNKNLGDFVDIGNARLTLRGIGGTLGQAGPTTIYDFGNGVTAEITAPAAAVSVDEGSSVSFTINTTGFTGSGSQYFAVKWVGSSGVDFSGGGDFTSGAPTYWYWYSAGTVTKTLTLRNDYSTNEGTETFKMQLVDPSDNSIVFLESPTVTINDTSTGTFAISVSAAETVTRNITVQNVSGSNYYFVDGVQAPALTFEKGKTYTFDQSNATNLNHPLRFKDGSGNSYSVGVTTGGTPGQAGAATTIAISSGIATSALRYYCTVHGVGMGNTISVGSATSVTEGNPIHFDITTTGVPNNTNLYYRLQGTGDTSGDFASGTIRDGYVLIGTNNTGIGTGVVRLTPIQDFEADNGETLYLNLYSSSSGSAPVLATSSTVTVNDAPFTVSVTSDVTTVQEFTSGGVTDSVTFTFSTTGVADGTVLRAYIEAVGSGSLFKARDVYEQGATGYQYGDDGNSLGYRYYNVTINNNAGSLTLKIVRDGKTEGNEQFRINAKSTSGVSLALSPTITIVDSSVVGLNKTGKTFGPIRVNRDNGNAANTSDWYTICNLDQIPNNSKVALFIDNSGSMTTGTVQASYDLLVSKLNARGITFITVENTSEDWISSFDTTL